MAGKSFFGRIMGRNQSETQAAVPMSQVNSAPQDDKTYEFNTRLGSSYLNVVNYGTKCTAPYSTEEITRMARDPMQYISELRQWAKWAYYSNGTVTTAIDSLVSLHSLDYVVVVKPKKAGGSRKGYRASMDKMTSVLRSMRYKEVIRDGLFHDANEGMYVGYMETRTVPVDDRLALTDLDIQGITEINSAGVNCVVISLPVEYTRIIGRRNNCYEVAFDLRYFKPADEAAIVMELNNKKLDKEDGTMDEKTKNELMAAVTGAVSEVNSKWEEYWAKVDTLLAEISQLKADIAQKEADIKQLQADYDKEAAAKEAAEAGLTEANAAKEAAEASLVEANAKITEMQNAAAVAELNAALAPYTEEQRAVAKEDIDAFNSNPGSVEINSIVGKICTAMVQAARESQIAETNAASQIDVFGMTDDAGKKENTDPADVDVF